MTRNQRIEFLIKNWMAARDDAKKKGFKNKMIHANGVLFGLKAALIEIKQLSNTQLKTDACECPQGSLCEFFTTSEQCRYGKI